VHKLEANLQVSGEAIYTNDQPLLANSAHAAFVLSTNANATLASIDVTAASAVDGFLDFICAQTMQENGFVNHCNWAGMVPEEIFASTNVVYYGQAIGLVVATSPVIAELCASLVVVTYSHPQTPIVTIAQVCALISALAQNGLYNY
jgi:xanthine dehydrogenase/oxidase